MKKILIAIVALFVTSFVAFANEQAIINTSDKPTYQTIIELVRLTNGQEDKRTFVINMGETASLYLGKDNSETTTIAIEKANMPGKDFVVNLDTSISFDRNGLKSVRRTSSQFPLADGERIRVSGSRMITEQDEFISEEVTEVWFEMNAL